MTMDKKSYNAGYRMALLDVSQRIIDRMNEKNDAHFLAAEAIHMLRDLLEEMDE